MAKYLQYFRETFPPAPEWSVDDIPDLTGKVMAVTGANTGIGKETAKAGALLHHNATVYMFCRSRARAEAAIADLKTQTGREARFVECDLGDLRSVKRATEDFLSKESQLHVLFNNGGVMLTPVEKLTAQGYDMQFGTNVLGHFYLTKLLLPIMQSTAAAIGIPARVIVTSSLMHWFADKIDYGLLIGENEKKRKCAGTTYLYSLSKLGNVLYAKELARRFGDKGIVCISLHPGQLKTELMRETSAFMQATRNIIFPVHEADMGALTQLRAGTDPAAAEWNGKYMTCWARLYPNSPSADNEAEAKGLWEWLEDQVKDI
ncbi:NAD(P)-binding protein [Schizophyllum commune H4-8]|uniref:NAD(P)-binding protein n=1 Tax=Schizophyllum commune (strain H4-8 / FGSC 9210) TaxID=578458 RepID=UPI00215FF4C0|nr:NAD(P)-binding protein [Schizophyllum commune H4-8]KAI5892224.1 NAD(P)-binding protein [Schizophyllum commune H4-8]